jgi:hypothetical protein
MKPKLPKRSKLIESYRLERGKDFRLNDGFRALAYVSERVELVSKKG